jgi:hypothetical protein
MTNEEKILDLLQAMQADIAGLKAGQDRLETKLMGEISGLAGMLADTQETVGAFRDETNKKLDSLNNDVTALKRLTTRNIYDIAILQEKIEPAGA